MDEDFSDSSCPLFLPDDHIRSVQTSLQAQLEGFHKTSPNINFIETQNLCENVKDKILNSEDESQLSKIHNNSRRISIASELFIGICSIYSFIVDCEFTKTIDTLIQWKKYNYISKKITHKMRSELKREKYFEKEAQSKLQKSIQDSLDDERPTEGPNEILKPTEGTQPATRDALTQEEISYPKEQELERVEVAESTQIDEINKVMRLTSEDTMRDEISSAVGNITVMRAESPADPSLIHLPSAHLETEMHSLVTSMPEIPIQETSLQGNGEADINKILQILEGDIVEREVPETFLETTVAVRESAENIVAEKPSSHREDGQMDQLDIEEWELPEVEPEKATKKKHHHVIIDKTITIHNYSERALYLNSNIKIQRVQVFEGPPQVLQAMSASHLMRTSGFKSSFFQDVRSSKLNRLFERHLMVEKKPVECITVPQTRPAEDLQEIRFPKIRASEEQVEDIAARAGMYSLPGKGDVLREMEKEKTHLEQTEISATGVQEKESLIGMPMSRIISPTAAAPPDLDKINTVAVPYSPRVQQLQGQSLDPEMHSSWFHSTKKNPPNAKYREFNYVYTKVQEYWSLFVIQGMKKSITLREFFALEMDGNVENFLTVLRILDKLSMQRKLLLKFENHEVVIQPFESPFVSEKQLHIKGKDPVL